MRRSIRVWSQLLMGLRRISQAISIAFIRLSVFIWDIRCAWQRFYPSLSSLLRRDNVEPHVEAIHELEQLD